jgi:hypothetical protein
LFNDVQAFIEAEGVGALEKARREALQGFEAGAFLLATPKGDCRFIGSHFQTACTLRLGMEQPFISNNDETCICGKRLDKKGIHLSRCKRGGEVIDRHDAIVRTLRQLAARAGIKCTYNPKGCFSSSSVNEKGEVVTFGGLTPDLRLFLAGNVVTGKDDNRHVVADVRITDSTALSQLLRCSYAEV